MKKYLRALIFTGGLLVSHIAHAGLDFDPKSVTTLTVEQAKQLIAC